METARILEDGRINMVERRRVVWRFAAQLRWSAAVVVAGTIMLAVPYGIALHAAGKMQGNSILLYSIVVPGNWTRKEEAVR